MTRRGPERLSAMSTLLANVCFVFCVAPAFICFTLFLFYYPYSLQINTNDNLDRKLNSEIEDQLRQGRILACVSSRPGQSGRADGYILEGPELAFYKRKLKSKK